MDLSRMIDVKALGIKIVEEQLIGNVDFHPSQPFEFLGELFKKANTWLQDNKDQVVLKVEVISYPVTDFLLYNDPDSSAKRKMLDQQAFSSYLRLWVRPRRTEDDLDVQVLYYVNIIPRKHRQSKELAYETLDQALASFYKRLNKHPLEGRILSVSTCEIAVPDWPSEIIADKTHWQTTTGDGTHYFMIIRLFLQLHTSQHVQTIEFEDFVPEITGRDSVTDTPTTESLSILLGRARQWMAHQGNISINDIQTVHYRIDKKSGEKGLFDITPTFMKRSQDADEFVLFIRVYYHQMFELPEDGVFEDEDEEVSRIDLHWRTFMPHVYRGTSKMPVNNFSKQSHTFSTLAKWCYSVENRKLGVETCAVVHTSAGLPRDCESTWYRTGMLGNIIVYVLRVYLDGAYNEPSTTKLPGRPPTPSPPPAKENFLCCSIQ